MNQEGFEQMNNDHGVEKNFISKPINIINQALYNKLKDKSDFERAKMKILRAFWELLTPEDIMSIFH